MLDMCRINHRSRDKGWYISFHVVILICPISLEEEIAIITIQEIKVFISFYNNIIIYCYHAVVPHVAHHVGMINQPQCNIRYVKVDEKISQSENEWNAYIKIFAIQLFCNLTEIILVTHPESSRLLQTPPDSSSSWRIHLTTPDDDLSGAIIDV